ncbi:MAG: RNA methyltransferase [Rhizobiaceae bacterium]|nr:RNA methyltransferase [Rhizobiaceae bacterium]
MSGTDRTQKLFAGGPVIILVEPQLGENIGMVARAMANFGLNELRLVNPRDGWPNEKARAAASRADHVIDHVVVFDTLNAAIADLHHVMATTARPRDMIKPVLAPEAACRQIHAQEALDQKTGLLFGRERWGLENHEIALADEIVTFPVNPAFASLNIAQAVLLMAYEWMRQSERVSETGFQAPDTKPARKEAISGLTDHLEQALEDANYFFPPEKAERMRMTVRSLFVNAKLQDPEVHALHGMIAALERRWLKKQQKKPDQSE